MQALCKPLENFFEERMQAYLLDIAKMPLLSKTMAMRIELGGVKDSDAMDEMFRQIAKRATYDG